MSLTNKVNTLIDAHVQIGSYEGIINPERIEYMKRMIELELLDLGHSLKGIKNLSSRNRFRG